MTPSVTLQAILLTAVVLFAGCSTVRTKTPAGESVSMTEAEFAAYVEQVFRHHNAVVNDLMFAANRIEDKDDPADAELMESETRMTHVCLPLNEMVSMMAVGHPPGFRTKLQLPDAVPECEAATRKVETLIPSGF